MTEENPYTPPEAAVVAQDDSSKLLQGRPAGLWIRTLAVVIDFLIFTPLWILNGANDVTWKSVPLAIAVQLLFAAYKIGMEGIYGATFGKMVLSIRVLDAIGEPPGLSRAALRYAPWFPSLLAGIALMIARDADPAFHAYTEWQLAGYVPSITDSTADLSYIASIILFVSCLTVVFNDTKRALHDYLARTKCVRTRFC